jgi:hypothetical protein
MSYLENCYTQSKRHDFGTVGSKTNGRSKINRTRSIITMSIGEEKTRWYDSIRIIPRIHHIDKNA